MLTAQDYHWRPPDLLCSCKHVQASLKKYNKADLRSVWAPSPRGGVGSLIPAVTFLSVSHSFATAALWGTCAVELDSTSGAPTGTWKGNQLSKLLLRRQGTQGIPTEEVDVESTWWVHPMNNSIRVTMEHGLPFPVPENLPDLGIEPWSPALWADALPSEP